MATEPDPYDFNAPQYFDFVRGESGGPNSMQAPPPPSVPAAAALPPPAEVVHGKVTAPDPWDFDAPTWTDLSAVTPAPSSSSSSFSTASPITRVSSSSSSSQHHQQPPAAAALVAPPTSQRTPSPSTPAPRSAYHPPQSNGKRPVSPAAAGAPAPPAPATTTSTLLKTPGPAARKAPGSPASSTSSSPSRPSLSSIASTPMVPQRTSTTLLTTTTTAAAAAAASIPTSTSISASMRMRTPEPRLPASPKASAIPAASVRKPTTPIRRVPSPTPPPPPPPPPPPARRPASPVAVAAPPPAPLPTTTTTTTTTTTATTTTAAAATAARTFVNRPRKEFMGPAIPQQHSYLAQTSATIGRRVAVNTMASFLRPTLASWGRNQKDGATSGSSSSSNSSSIGMGRSSGPTVVNGRPGGSSSSSSNRSSRSGPVRAMVMGRGGISSSSSSSSSSINSNSRVNPKESTEERSLRLGQEARERLKQQVRANQLAYQRNKTVGGTAGSAPLRSTKALTIPLSPQLRLSARHGEKHRSTSGMGHNPRDPEIEIYHKPRAPSPSTFGGSSSSSSSSSSNTYKGPKPLTIPVAPSFQTDTRALARRASPTYNQTGPGSSSSSSQAEAFSHSHPPPSSLRINSSSGMGLREYVPKPPSPRALTIPHTPNLSTKTRAAVRKGTGVTYGGREGGREDEEECQHQFKARPLDRRILESTGEMGVPKVAKGGVTQPQPFHFSTDSRPRVRGGEGEQQQQQQQRHHHQEGGLSVPRPFQLATEQRGQVHKMAFVARVTQDREAEKAAREVHAHPVPHFHQQQAHAQPQPSTRPLTEFDEFHLSSARRHEDAEGTWQREVERLKEEERKQAQGPRARPLPATTFQRGFEPKPSEREPLFPQSLNLSTSARAQERKAFDADLQVRSEETRLEKEAQREAKQREEQEKLRRMRMTPVEQGGMKFVAKPIQHSSHPLAPAPSMRKLTVPVSPQFKTTERSHMRPQQQQLQRE